MKLADQGKVLLFFNIDRGGVELACKEIKNELSELLGQDVKPEFRYLWGKSDILASVDTTDLQLPSRLGYINHVTRYNHFLCYQWLPDPDKKVEKQFTPRLFAYCFCKFNPILLDKKGMRLEHEFVHEFQEYIAAEQTGACNIYGGVGWNEIIIELSTENDFAFLWRSLLKLVNISSSVNGKQLPNFRTTFTLFGFDLPIFNDIFAAIKEHDKISECSTMMPMLEDKLRGYNLLPGQDSSRCFPFIQLRVQPSFINKVEREFFNCFSRKKWEVSVTVGKSDLMFTRKLLDEHDKGCEIGAFILRSLFFYDRCREPFGECSRLFYPETYFKKIILTDNPILPDKAELNEELFVCQCNRYGISAAELKKFIGSVETHLGDLIGRNLRNNLRSLFVLYNTCLSDSMICCNFKDMSYFITSFKEIIEEFITNSLNNQPTFFTREELEDFIRDGCYHGFELINQRRNSSYEDIWVSSDRVIAFKGGVHRIIEILNGVVAETLANTGVERLKKLPVVFKYSLVDSILSDPRLGLVGIPIRFLFWIQKAGWRMWHEIGEIFFFHETPFESDDAIRNELIRFMKEMGWDKNDEQWENGGAVLLKEIFCDFFAFRFGFSCDLKSYIRLFLSGINDVMKRQKRKEKGGNIQEDLTLLMRTSLIRLLAVADHFSLRASREKVYIEESWALKYIKEVAGYRTYNELHDFDTQSIGENALSIVRKRCTQELINSFTDFFDRMQKPQLKNVSEHTFNREERENFYKPGNLQFEIESRNEVILKLANFYENQKELKIQAVSSSFDFGKRYYRFIINGGLSILHSTYNT